MNWEFGMAVANAIDRSLLYVEADARMDNYEDKEGKTQSSLSLIASEYLVSRRGKWIGS